MEKIAILLLSRTYYMDFSADKLKHDKAYQ